MGIKLYDDTDVLKDFAIVLMFLWLLACSVAIHYLNNVDKQLLAFADFVIDDNLKNVIQSGGQTYYIVDTIKINTEQKYDGVNFVTPMYVSEKDLAKLTQWKRKMVLMVKEFNELDITGKQLDAQANGYFKRKLAETQERKRNLKEKDNDKKSL
jgi:hypothetical protein